MADNKKQHCVTAMVDGVTVIILLPIDDKTAIAFTELNNLTFQFDGGTIVVSLDITSLDYYDVSPQQ